MPSATRSKAAIQLPPARRWWLLAHQVLSCASQTQEMQRRNPAGSRRNGCRLLQRRTGTAGEQARLARPTSSVPKIKATIEPGTQRASFRGQAMISAIETTASASVGQ